METKKIKKLLREALWDSGIDKERRDNFARIYKENLETVNKAIITYPDMWVDEVGLEIVLNFLAVEDGMNFRLQHGLTKGKVTRFDKPIERNPEESEIDYILRANKIEYSWEQIKFRLIHYFGRRVYANVAKYDFNNIEEVMKFLNTYKEAFLYEYLIPMSKNK